MNNGPDFKLVKPDESLAEYVESFWQLRTPADSAREIVVLPDGRVDMILSQSAKEPFHITLSGLETYPQQVLLPAGTLMCAISFRLTAVEYIFQNTISSLLNYATYLPAGFWELNADDLQNFNQFCKKVSRKIISLLPKQTDNRKRELFNLIYASEGSLTVKELSEKVYWSSRQINRYFNGQFGLSLKAYCNILRFRASLQNLAAGKFFPDLSFADQSHFIREVKKFSGVSPKELKQNRNDRFIQFSVLGSK